MTLPTSLTAGLLSMLMAVHCLAQDRRSEIRGDLINDLDQSAVALHPATPYLEPSTVLLADIDLSKIDVDAAMEWLQEMAGIPQNESGTEMVRGFLQSLQGGGVEHVFATAATRSMFDGGPLLILPCENTAVVSGLASVVMQQVPQEPAQKIHTGDGVVLAGATSAIDRVTKAEGADRPDLILPLRSEDRLDHSLVFSLPMETRQELIALWPNTMPAESPIPFSPRRLVEDIQRLVITWSMPPQPTVRLWVETADAGAADRVQQIATQLVDAADPDSSIEITTKLDIVELTASAEAFKGIIQRLLAPSQRRADQMTKMNSMKMIGLAIHNYYAKENHLPPRYFTDDEGTPLLSWRVALLPHIEQLAMYRAIALDKPWDDESNLLHSQTLIPLYCDDPLRGATTTLRAPVLSGSVWEGDGPPKEFRDIKDGTSNTIAIIDAPETAATEWSNPNPWILSADDPMTDVFGDRQNVTVLLLDGSVRVLARDEMDNDTLKAMLTIAGREVVQ